MSFENVNVDLVARTLSRLVEIRKGKLFSEKKNGIVILKKKKRNLEPHAKDLATLAKELKESLEKTVDNHKTDFDTYASTYERESNDEVLSNIFGIFTNQLPKKPTEVYVEEEKSGKVHIERKEKTEKDYVKVPPRELLPSKQDLLALIEVLDKVIELHPTSNLLITENTEEENPLSKDINKIVDLITTTDSEKAKRSLQKLLDNPQKVLNPTPSLWERLSKAVKSLIRIVRGEKEGTRVEAQYSISEGDKQPDLDSFSSRKSRAEHLTSFSNRLSGKKGKPDQNSDNTLGAKSTGSGKKRRKRKNS